MIDFLRDLFGRPGVARTVILLEPDSMSMPRQYEVRPGYAIYAAVIGIVGLAAILIAAAVLTPLRGLLVGPGSSELRVVAERNAARAEALEDSLAAQGEQVDLLRVLITGEATDPSASVVDGSEPGLDRPAEGAPDLDEPATRASVPAPRRAERDEPVSGVGGVADRYLTGLRAPVALPLNGVVSRAFAPDRGHHGLDIAADTGTPVLSAGAGTVVLSDWIQGGGLTVAVQHAGGYLSIYKHNSRVLRRDGDRVQAREALALSGNTGDVTSGPHLHVEVWRDGRALDPASFFLIR